MLNWYWAIESHITALIDLKHAQWFVTNNIPVCFWSERRRHQEYAAVTKTQSLFTEQNESRRPKQTDPIMTGRVDRAMRKSENRTFDEKIVRLYRHNIHDNDYD